MAKIRTGADCTGTDCLVDDINKSESVVPVSEIVRTRAGEAGQFFFIPY